MSRTKEEEKARQASFKTYELQDKLPSVPVPELLPAMEKYLRSLRPLLNASDFIKTQVSPPNRSSLCFVLLMRHNS